MGKHLLDKHPVAGDARARHYARIARKTGPAPHPKVKAAMRSSRAVPASSRLRAYLRVERGLEA